MVYGIRNYPLKYFIKTWFNNHTARWPAILIIMEQENILVREGSKMSLLLIIFTIEKKRREKESIPSELQQETIKWCME